MHSNPTPRQASNDLTAIELDQICGAGSGLSYTIIPFVPPPPGPPIVLHRGPIGH